MIWLTWRQHRIEALIGALVLALLCIVLVINGLYSYSLYRSMHMAACVAQGAACDNSVQYAFLKHVNVGVPFFAITLLPLLPAVVGAFIGAPLVAREREHRTHYLIWTQSVTRIRWLAVKLGLITGAVVLAFVILAFVTAWWAAPTNALLGPWTFYDIKGLVLPGYALFGLMLGVAVGAVIRRAIPAMALTLIIFFLFSLLMHYVYPYLVPPESSLYPVSITSQNGAWGRPGDLTLYAGYADRAGNETGELSQYCGFSAKAATAADPGYDTLANKCIKDHNLQWKIIYQPPERFWLLQGVETIVLLVLAALLVAFTFWWLRKRIN